MGHGSYSLEDRESRSVSRGYTSKSRDEIFVQQKQRKIHPEMDPKGVHFREARDSAEHPNTVPIQLYLDLTGSMGAIPHDFIKDGLPTMMGTLIQSGVKDAALMFGGIGDHECDYYPLQIGQFESGDEELDMWLTRTYIEEGGGGNDGESYLLAWYFSAFHTKTDAFEKRNQKGFVFTIGDEPVLRSLPVSAIKQIMGSSASVEKTFTAEELLKEAEKSNHVFHIFLEHGYRRCDQRWKDLLGENLLIVSDYREIPKLIASVVMKYAGQHTAPVSQPAPQNTESSSSEEVKIVL